MSVIVALLAEILHIGLLLAAAPATAGAMGWLEARLGGRAAPPLTGPWRQLVRLRRKASVIPEGASPLLTLAPLLSLGATICAAALVPSFTLGTALAPLADGLVVASLLSLAQAAAVLGALDTGSAASGMAAQQDSALAVLVEPALLLFVFCMALMAGSFNLDLIVGQQQDGGLLPGAASALALTALLALACADISNASSGLHQDYGGIDLAVTRATTWLRRLVWIDLIGCLFLPFGMAGSAGGVVDWGIGLICWFLKLLAAIVALSVIRALSGRVTRRDLPSLAGIAALLALLATIMVLASAGTA